MCDTDETVTVTLRVSAVHATKVIEALNSVTVVSVTEVHREFEVTS